jgi:hypothetical protein
VSAAWESELAEILNTQVRAVVTEALRIKKKRKGFGSLSQFER